ncbi:hypothetical protein [Actinoplanes sp. RD1]|uniref:hypothetical protein n=1 Tax=Actinoplanes sp. RD1 TaxID=3064538 RepID=UPI003557F618
MRRSTTRTSRPDVDLPGVVPLRPDITDPAPVAAAAGDVTLLINNAGRRSTRLP